MTNDEILKIALENGFKLKEQPNGEMALNPYVYDFANAIIKHDRQSSAEPVAWRIEVDDEQRQEFVDNLDDACDDLTNHYAVAVPLYTRPQAAPEGWKLVPVEPTQAMVEAGKGHCTQEDEEDDPRAYRAIGQCCAVYKFMLDASPQPEKKL